MRVLKEEAFPLHFYDRRLLFTVMYSAPFSIPPELPISPTSSINTPARPYPSPFPKIFPHKFDIKGFRNSSDLNKIEDKTQIKVNESELSLYLKSISAK